MGYLHIENLYKNQDILLFKECYAMEKIHGTSAHISWTYGAKEPKFFSGGESHERFVSIFNKEELTEKLANMGYAELTIYGEAYGGKQQNMKDTYGPDLKFIVFDVETDSGWMTVPEAEKVAQRLGLEFVHYVKIPTDLALLDKERDADSVQAVRNGMGEGKMREGVILRPLIEVSKGPDGRVIAKYKRDDFRETTTTRKVVDPSQLKVLEDAEAIANEWVTTERLKHVLDKLPQDIGIESTGLVIKAMTEDVLREANKEIVVSDAAKKSISKRTAGMFKQYLNQKVK